MARQQIGRFMRRNAPQKGEPNSGIANYQEDYATIFVSQDAKILALLRQYEEATYAEHEERFVLDDDVESCDRCNVRLFHIPRSFEVNVEFKDLEVVWPYGSPEASVAAFRAMHPLFAHHSHPELEAAMRSFLAVQQHPRVASEKERLHEVKDKIKKAAWVLAGNVLRLQGIGEPSSKMIGEGAESIHRQWIRQANLRHHEMTYAEFQEKLVWIDATNEALFQTREAPAWLRI